MENNSYWVWGKPLILDLFTETSRISLHMQSQHTLGCNMTFAFCVFHSFVAEVQLLQQSQWKKCWRDADTPSMQFHSELLWEESCAFPSPFHTQSNEGWYWQTGTVPEIESTIQKAEIASHRQKNSKSPSTKGNIDHKWLLSIPFWCQEVHKLTELK